MLCTRWRGKNTYVRLRYCYRLLVLMMNGWTEGWHVRCCRERVGWLYDAVARRLVYMGAFRASSWSAVHIALIAPGPTLFFLSIRSSLSPPSLALVYIRFHAVLKMYS